MMGKIIIAIDGYSSCGKSTLARDLAQMLGYKYIDTGAMYRAITYYFQKHQVDAKDEKAVEKALNKISIDFSFDQDFNQITHLNGEPVEQEIRTMEVSSLVSRISTLGQVREKLVEKQQSFGEEKGIVMDGRDIGTVVFPDAELKIFMTASQQIRMQRRYEELKKQGKIISIEEVRKNLEERDYIDTHRTISPLKKAEDAFVLDNSHMSMEEQKQWAYEKAMAIIEAKDPASPAT